MSASISYKYMNSYASTQNYKTMTLLIDESNPDSEKCCTYADDAVGMPCGFTEEAIAAWKEFFDYKPCIMLNGKVLYYLDPDDYRKTIDGGTTLLPENVYTISMAQNLSDHNPLYSSQYKMFGDVMVEVPRLGIKLSKSGSVVTLSITNHPNKAGFQYYAHTFKNQTYKKLYISAFPASAIDDGGDRHLCSTPYTSMDEYPDEDYETDEDDCGPFIRTFAKTGGKAQLLGFINSARKGLDTYHMTTYHQYTLIQCMTYMHMKNLSFYDVLKRDTYIWSSYNQARLFTSGLFWNIHDSDHDFGVHSLFGIRGLLGTASMGSIALDGPGYHITDTVVTVFDGICIYNNHWYINREEKYITDLTDLSEYTDCGPVAVFENGTSKVAVKTCNVNNEIGFIPSLLDSPTVSPYGGNAANMYDVLGAYENDILFPSNEYSSYDSEKIGFYSRSWIVRMRNVAEAGDTRPCNTGRIYISALK